MIQENEKTKYLKSTGSNISKSNRKSKHKHHYEECLIQHPFSFAEHDINRIKKIIEKYGSEFKSKFIQHIGKRVND